MKMYIGVPGNPSAVAVGEPEGTRKLDGAWSWGDAQPGSADLALAILIDYLGSEEAARPYYRRFMWRTTAVWTADKPWKLSSDEIDMMLGDWRRDEPQLATIRAQVKSTPVPIEREGGMGPGGTPVSAIERKG